MAAILGVDAAFPYQSLGPIASLVPFIVTSVVSLLGISGVTITSNPINPQNLPWVFNQGNLLLIGGVKRTVLLEINWPCAGLMSMLIYILVVCILMVKLDTPPKRKTIYAFVGAIGTFLVNIIRIFLIALAVAYSNINIHVFHESIGEILFIIWIIVYLVTVISIEGKISKQIGESTSA
jgi:thaumarchaeosortase